MPCSHIICRLNSKRDETCYLELPALHQGSKFGRPPPADPQPETVALVNEVLARLDRRILRAEVERLDTLEAVSRLIDTLASERHDVSMQWNTENALRRFALIDRVKRWCEGSDQYQLGSITVTQRTADSLKATPVVGGEFEAQWEGDGNSFTVRLHTSGGQLEPDNVPQSLEVVGSIEWSAFVDWINEVDRAIHGKT